MPRRVRGPRGGSRILTAASPTAVAVAAGALHRWLTARHLEHGVVVGPDPGLRINYRAGRFVKSYGRMIPWRDDLCYLQGQGYWTLANWRLSDLEPSRHCEQLAIACARGIIDRQRPDGAWAYPNPEWRGRVVSAEGTWAAVGLLETFRRTEDERYLDAALRWHGYLVEHIGWQPAAGGEAVNYFGDRPGPPVPNNSAMVLRLLAELADATSDDGFLERCDPMLTFLENAQRPTGELPYQVGRDGAAPRLEHFQCYQYNAFQALDLRRFEELAASRRAGRIAANAARFVCAGVTPEGTIPYACKTPNPRVTYHLAAVSAALAAAARDGDADCAQACLATSDRLLRLQRADGGFPHSHRDYGVLSDRRSYPRYLAMILLHLLEIDAAGMQAQS